MKYLSLIFFILLMTAGNAFGAMLLKTTMSRVKVFSLKKTFSQWTLYLGIFLYFLGSFINIFLMKAWDYSTIYPMTSLSCVWTLLFSSIFLGEKITAQKLIGIFFIILGAFLICLN